MSFTVASLHIYPVKSLAGIALAEAIVEERGLRHDRRWMIVDGDNSFITQRTVPQMATIATAIDQDERLVLSRNGSSIQVPAHDPLLHPAARVTVWDSSVPGAFVSPEADAWLSDALSFRCRLVYMPDTSRRPIDPDYAAGEEIVSFADGYPILLASSASLRDLNMRSGEIIPMDRFRPNIVVDADAPFAEDEFGRFGLGGAVLEGVKPCSRCIITTMDQQTGARMGKEPLKTLATYRQKANKVNFGENLVVRAPGSVRIGDRIVPLQPRGEFPRIMAS